MTDKAMNIIGVLMPIITLVLGIMYDIYFKDNNPAKKKAASYIKKFFSFIFKYGFPITVLIINFRYLDFNKLFIFSCFILFSQLTLQITLDFISSSDKTHFKAHYINSDAVKKMALEIDELKKELKNVRQQ